MLIDFTPRSYQEKIFNSSLYKNTLVVLPTGLGKTAIAMMLAARRLLLYPKSKIVFLAPTKPLVEQQMISFKKHFVMSEEKFTLFTGSVSPTKRASLWDKASIIFSTPQTLENDVLSGRINFKDVSLLIFDEAHRASGNYAYVFLAKEYSSQSFHQRILALSASPGTDKESIKAIMKNLFLENIEFRKTSDEDVKKYIQGVDISWEEVILPEYLTKVVNYLKKSLNEKISKVEKLGFLKNKNANLTKSTILTLQQELHTILQTNNSPELFNSISLLSQAFKILHSLELVQTQSIAASYHYMNDLLSKSRVTKVRAIKNLVIDPNFLSALSILRKLYKEKIEHPKITLLKAKVENILSTKPAAKIIIFSQFRETATRIKEMLNYPSELFFGQAKKNGQGLSQKQQRALIEDFSNNKFSCLIATSVAEEGLDIPSVDHVFFFEPLPSAIRSVQRRGRTGRHTKGFVSVFVTKNTPDEIFRWVSFHREKRMFEILETFSKNNTINQTQDIKQQSLDSYSVTKKDEGIKVIVDYREKGSLVLKSLRSIGVSLELRHLDVGDFVVSKEVCIEFKNYDDFIDSIIDGRLLVQLRSLAQYPKPLLILQGDSSRSRNHLVDETAIMGMISTISLSYRIPIIRTNSPFESAKYIHLIAKREQEGSSSGFTFHSTKPLTDKEILEYIVSSFPNIGLLTAKSLLEKFDSLQALISASEKELKEIPLIGQKKSAELVKFFSLSYKNSKDINYSSDKK